VYLLHTGPAGEKHCSFVGCLIVLVNDPITEGGT